MCPLYPLNTINIVVVSRLTYRKGTDLLVDVIPAIAAMFPETYFIIGGDGPKRVLLEQIREKHGLHNRMELLGSIPHSQVRNVLVRGHIFLNTSLTEAFCIAIVEAAACGLKIVTTNVGGIVEVLPSHMVSLAKPDPQCIIDALCETIPQAREVPAQQFHEEVASMYSWRNVAERTERVYDKIVLPNNALGTRVGKYTACGPWAGILGVFIMVLDCIFLAVLCWLVPESSIEAAPDFPTKEYAANKRKYGSHEERLLPPTVKK